jgi:sugar phosphate isomerase/epimerase
LITLGISNLYLVGKPFEAVEKVMERIRVKHWELIDEDTLRLNADRVKILKDLKSTFNLHYVVHAPFADTNLASFNAELREVILRQLERSLYHTYRLDSSLWVTHPGMHTGLSAVYPGRDYEINLRSIERLARKAEDLGITIAVENMPKPFRYFFEEVGELERFLHDLRSDNVEVAFDIGHANTAGQVNAFIERLSDRIVHAHAHDNDGSFDDHLPIGEGSVDWKSVLTELYKRGFKGILTTETKNPLADLKRLSELLKS